MAKSGGVIGSVLTRAVAVLFMQHWSRKFKSKVQSATESLPDSEFKLLLLQYYVDDGNICITALPPGSRFVKAR